MLKRDGGFTLAVVMCGYFEKGTDIEVAKKAMEVAHQFCPYSYATRGNISVELKVVCEGGFLLCAGMTRFLGLEEVFDFLEEYMVVSCEKF